MIPEGLGCAAIAVTLSSSRPREVHSSEERSEQGIEVSIVSSVRKCSHPVVKRPTATSNAIEAESGKRMENPVICGVNELIVSRGWLKRNE